MRLSIRAGLATAAVVGACAVAVIGVSGASAVGLGGASADDIPDSKPLVATNDPVINAYGIQRSEARPGVRTSSGKQLLSSGNQEIACISDQHGGGHCAPRKLLADGIGFGLELCVDDLPADQFRVTGLVPAGVKSVTLSVPNGQSWQEQVVADTVAFEIPRAAAKDARAAIVSWTVDRTAGGAEVPLPPMVTAANCG